MKQQTRESMATAKGEGNQLRLNVGVVFARVFMGLFIRWVFFFFFFFCHKSLWVYSRGCFLFGFGGFVLYSYYSSSFFSPSSSSVVCLCGFVLGVYF